MISVIPGAGEARRTTDPGEARLEPGFSIRADPSAPGDDGDDPIEQALRSF